MHLLKECIQVYGFYHVIVCLHKSTLLRVIPTMAFQGIYIYSDIYSDILPNILSDIYSDILSAILSGIYSGILSEIYSGIISDIYSDILSGILSDILFWHALCSGPTGATAIYSACS